MLESIKWLFLISFLLLNKFSFANSEEKIEKTYTIGIPVGTLEGMIDPIKLNNWALENGLVQNWDLAPGGTLDAIYERSVEVAEKHTNPTLQDVRAWAEKDRVIESIKKYTKNINDYRRLLPGQYTGQFLFGAKPTTPIATDTELAASQLSISLLDNSKSDVLSKVKLETIKPVADPRASAMQFVELPEKLWHQFAKTFGNVEVETGVYPISIKLENNDINPSSFILADKDKDAIKAALAQPNFSSPTIIVIDDSWPSDATSADAMEFRNAVNFFCDALDELWVAKKPYDYSERKCPDSLRYAKNTDSPKGFKCIKGQDCRTHALKIKQALSEFTSMASANGKSPIKVIYLPFNTAQSYSWDILSRILIWHAINRPSFIGMNISSRDSLNSYRTFIDATKKSMSSELIRGAEYNSSSLLVFNAIMTFAQTYSLLKGEPVYINASWTFNDKYAPVSAADLGFNMVFAAVPGNCDPNASNPIDRCTTDYMSRLEEPIRFVKETEADGNYVGVMSLAQDGSPSCKSMRLVSKNVALGFSGAIDGDCGTSFASPRVAWLYALYTAKAPRVSSQLKTESTAIARNWSVQTMARFRDFRVCEGSFINDYSCMYLKPQNIFKPFMEK